MKEPKQSTTKDGRPENTRMTRIEGAKARRRSEVFLVADTIAVEDADEEEEEEEVEELDHDFTNSLADFSLAKSPNFCV